ncbi:hypothetical protein IH879_17780, partial [candidate division KSB1 bacterium]|nr:hypothetical protein [candidate division KSB1 bacterium]
MSGITQSSFVKEFSETVTTASETLVTVGDIILLHGAYRVLDFELKTSGGTPAAIDTFELQVRQHGADGVFITPAAIATWTGPQADRIFRVSTNLAALAHATSGDASVRVGVVNAVRFQVAFAAGGANIVVVVKGLAAYGS